ncbi:MAG: DNA starvation/stationary phase protection protein [Anaerolineae bacterium]|nr:DNA starvation/stationary phase protection protein [Anaerolineae bacterium]
MATNDTVVKLNKLVADFTVFYQKLRHYHWNVKGEQFFMLHTKFEEIYDEVNLQIDELAERIIGLGGTPYHTLAHMLDESALSEDSEVPNGATMVQRLLADMETLTGNLEAAIEVTEAAEDRTTTNLLDGINDGLKAHMWMLRAWQK